MTQTCVSDAFQALKGRFPDLFFDFIEMTHQNLYEIFRNLLDPEMRQYFTIDDQIPCDRESVENLLHSFTKQKITIRYFICKMIKGVHEGGLLYSVEENILYLNQPSVVYTTIQDVEKHSNDFTIMLNTDVDDYAFVLRSSRNPNARTEIGAGHMMLVRSSKDLRKDLLVGKPAHGLK